MAWYFYVGLIAAVCIAAFSMPQLIYTVKTKNTSGVSLWMFIILAFGDLCFSITGIGMVAAGDLSGGLPVLIANSIACTIGVVILFYKIRNLMWAKKFKTTEKDLCDNYQSYRTKVKIAKAEKIKAKAVTVEEPKETSIPKPTSGEAGNGDTAQVIG